MTKNAKTPAPTFITDDSQITTSMRETMDEYARKFEAESPSLKVVTTTTADGIVVAKTERKA